MVWTNVNPQGASPSPAIRSWLSRIAARLGQSFAPPAAANPAPFLAEHDSATRRPFQAGFTRVSPLQNLPAKPASHATSARESASGSGARFHAVVAEDVALVMYLSRRRGIDLPCLDWIAENDMPFRRIATLSPQGPVWSAPRGVLLLVDLDTLGGVAAIAADLMRLREGRPDIAVVLLSEEVSSHDFGLERLALADVTLRLPCAFASFEFALTEAPINNAVWQERQAAPRG